MNWKRVLTRWVILSALGIVAIWLAGFLSMGMGAVLGWLLGAALGAIIVEMLQ